MHSIEDKEVVDNHPHLSLFYSRLEKIIAIALRSQEPEYFNLEKHFLYKLYEDPNKNALNYSTASLKTQLNEKLIIKRIQFYQSNIEESGGLLLLSCYNAPKLAFYLDVASSLKIRNIFLNNLSKNVERYDNYSRSGSAALDWSNFNAHYSNKTVQSIYAKLHKKITHIVSKEIFEILANTESIVCLNIIDAACGENPILENVVNRLNINENFKNKLKIRTLGFDFNSENIEYCQENFRGSYVEGNLLKIDEVVEQARSDLQLHPVKMVEDEKSETQNETHFTILIASGATTRLVLENIFQCIQFLQSAYHAAIDKMICMGLTEILFDPHIAKYTGFEIETIISEDSPIHMLVPQKLDEILAYKLNRFIKKDFPLLDLSMSSCPVDILKNFKKNYRALVEEIDISYCRVKDLILGGNNELLDLLKSEYPNLKKITFKYIDNNIEEHDENVKLFFEYLNVLNQNCHDKNKIKIYFEKIFGNQEIFTMSENARRRLAFQVGLFKPKPIIQIKSELQKKDRKMSAGFR